MFPGQVWKKLGKPLTLLCCTSTLIGFILLGLQPDIKPAAYFFLSLGGLLLLICLLFHFKEWRLQAMPTDTSGALSAARDNAAFEVPSYEEAVVSTQGPNSDLGEPPPYSTVIPLPLQEEEPNRLAALPGALRRGRSEGQGGTGLKIQLLSLVVALDKSPNNQKSELEEPIEVS
ncbi:transmembrane protein 139 isoform X2 [Vombatus ursinus]|uniref:transmembrane protein 139 isoform X2 n=1 Tax=Vombatus ursinus TaxID=29139 RepID=UPI000FFCFE9F|nr:transmembrane protein 139 isoform X2 [Vombatus ursinus]